MNKILPIILVVVFSNNLDAGWFDSTQTYVCYDKVRQEKSFIIVGDSTLKYKAEGYQAYGEAYITHSDERIVQGDFSNKREGAVVYTFDRKLKTLSWGYKGNLGTAHCH